MILKHLCFVLKGILPHIGSAEVQTRTDMATMAAKNLVAALTGDCLLYTSPSPRDATLSRMPSSA